jgi:hypothetical protein
MVISARKIRTARPWELRTWWFERHQLNATLAEIMAARPERD